MTRHKYVLSEEEIRTLMSGIISLGAKDTYAKMLERMLVAKEQGQEADELCMDMYESMLQRARVFGEGRDDKDTLEIKQTLYQLSTMFRTLAHDLHRLCPSKTGSGRFLEIVSNTNAKAT